MLNLAFLFNELLSPYLARPIVTRRSMGRFAPVCFSDDKFTQLISQQGTQLRSWWVPSTTLQRRLL